VKKPVGERVSARAVASQNLHFSGGGAEVREPVKTQREVAQPTGERFHFSGGSAEALEGRNSKRGALLEWRHRDRSARNPIL
jgi:hypothetical protein